jgi:hypothetical protein
MRAYGLYGSNDITLPQGTGITVYLPAGDDLGNHPLIVALRKAGLDPIGNYAA